MNKKATATRAQRLKSHQENLSYWRNLAASNAAVFLSQYKGKWTPFYYTKVSSPDFLRSKREYFRECFKILHSLKIVYGEQARSFILRRLREVEKAGP